MDAPEPPPGGKRICFCCNKLRSTRSLARHLRVFLDRFNQHLVQAGLAGDLEALEEDLHAADVALPVNAEMDIDGNLDGNGAEALDVDHQPIDPNFGGFGVGAAGPLGHGPPERIGPQRAHEPMFNIPVEINNWPDPGSDGDSDSSSVEQADNLDGDPAFEEQPFDPADLGLDPLYEPNLSDEQALALMREHLGDLADEEWVYLYNSTLSYKDKITLRFLATRLRTHFSRQTYNELRYGPCELLDIPSEFIAYRRLAILAGAGYNSGCLRWILDNPEDLALGLSTDGFTLFKRRRRVSCPPRKYNLLLEELLRLEHGIDSIKTTPAQTPEHEEHPEEEGEGELTEFKLRAFLIMVFGDIPAVSKLLAMKGHNAMVPCRTCYTQGVLCRLERNSVYYIPLSLPGEEEGYPPDMLLLRTHELFLSHYRSLDNLDDQRGRRKQLSKELGINDRPIFARLKSFDLACCAPYDIMHLLFENLVPNMIKHWTVWKQIGKETAKATRTIPVTFVGTLPDIAEDQTLYKAEAYSFWIQYIAPIVLQDRLPEPYFEHFLLMRDIVIMSIQVDITVEQIDELEQMINCWVIDYERYYYQYDYNRLPACPLTIHALLHMPYYIRKTGPLWASWAFVMERFCGHLLPAVKNRFQPYRHLDNAVLRRGQMQVVAHTYGLPTLPRSTVKWRNEGGTKIFPRSYWAFQLKKAFPVDVQLTNQLTKFLGPIYHPRFTTGAELRARIDWQTIVSYGRFRMADDGYRIRTASAVQRTQDSTGSSRDNSFVRFTVLPDANASNDGSDVAYEEVNYGQLIGIYYLEFITDFETNTRDHYLVARIQSCQGTGFLDAALPENPKVTYRTLSTPDIFHLMTIDAVIGRIQVAGGEWAIIDCSRNGARTQFTNDDDDADD
ncbi:hypothetical protein RhiLY_10275 [Ceratobasidium sp. AG-Ba]|nr:hypothetical protein RhiLY_10275 [Ceratobasidium sp. AG-Ba]